MGLQSTRINTAITGNAVPAGRAHTFARVHVLAAGDAGSTLTLRWEGVAGTIIAVIDTTAAPFQYDFNLDSQGSGLYYDNAAGTTTPGDVVLSWS